MIPEIIFTDVDDTLTWHGELPLATLQALYQLRDAGIGVIPVTGACAGWCDQMARLWPVMAVIGENGAFCIEKHQGALTYIDTQDLETRQNNNQKLTQVAAQMLAKYPLVGLAKDNQYRRYDLAIDFNQECRGMSLAAVSQMVADIHQLGIKATISSIHVNTWIGEQSKLSGARQWLARNRPEWNEAQIRERCAYSGDSPNDEPMFSFFKNTVGVANIAPYLPLMKHHPAKVMSQCGGAGFAEWVTEILQQKHPQQVA
ncbi:MAG: HAD-IIB family hydrolase [Ferrimonas sp.]